MSFSDFVEVEVNGNEANNDLNSLQRRSSKSTSNLKYYSTLHLL